MVMLSSTLKGRVLKFVSAALDPTALQVVSFRGREAISSTYRYDLELVSTDPEIDTSAVIQASSSIGIKQGVPVSGGKKGIRTLRIHGAVSSIEQCGRVANWAMYRVVLVPRLWRLSVNVQTRIFLEKSIPEIVEEVLKTGGFSADDYELRLGHRKYPKREYVVQYQESDLNFLQRLLEHEGVAYFFDQGEEKEKIVFADSPSSFPALTGQSEYPYHPAMGKTGTTGDSGDWFQDERVAEFSMRHSVVPAEVALRDYNYRTPSADLTASAPAAKEGFGRHYEYGNHYKDPGEGKDLARVRAEEFVCRSRVFPGTSDIRSLRTGFTFTLDKHYRGEFNRSYLLVEVSHEARQSLELSGAAALTTAKYSNEFLAIPADVPFRPARVTPKPRIAGFMHAKIDAAGDGEYAEIDDEGRYKVALPFDPSGRKDAKASRWIRMMQPYSGPNFGFHFPLHKGAEVLIAHLDGDPDRPVIAGAVPNPETSTPVKGENQSQCVIRTCSGNEIKIENSKGGERIALFSPHSKTTFAIGSPMS